MAPAHLRELLGSAAQLVVGDERLAPFERRYISERQHPREDPKTHVPRADEVAPVDELHVGSRAGRGCEDPKSMSGGTLPVHGPQRPRTPCEQVAIPLRLIVSRERLERLVDLP